MGKDFAGGDNESTQQAQAAYAESKNGGASANPSAMMPLQGRVPLNKLKRRVKERRERNEPARSAGDATEPRALVQRKPSSPNAAPPTTPATASVSPQDAGEARGRFATEVRRHVTAFQGMSDEERVTAIDRALKAIKDLAADPALVAADPRLRDAVLQDVAAIEAKLAGQALGRKLNVTAGRKGGVSIGAVAAIAMADGPEPGPADVVAVLAAVGMALFAGTAVAVLRNPLLVHNQGEEMLRDLRHVLEVDVLSRLPPLEMARTGDKAKAKSESRAVAKAEEDEKPQHRGRLQVQGHDMAPELSFAWAQSMPMTKGVALTELEGLKSGLTTRQYKLRDEAFVDAARFISTNLVTAPPRVSRTFRNRELRGDKAPIKKTARVDVEIINGLAFA